MCQLKFGYNQTCSRAEQCDDSKQLDCVSNKCLCKRDNDGNQLFYMASNNSCLSCPSGWYSGDRICTESGCQNRNLSFNFCYKHYTTPRNWTDAYAQCLSIGANLVNIKTSEDFTFLRTFSLTANYSIWVLFFRKKIMSIS